MRNVDADGDILSVYTEGRDGKTVSNVSGLAKATAAALVAGRDYKGKFAYDTTPAKWTERRVAAGAEHLAYPAAEGEKWIDVDLSRHTMTAYVGAKVVYGPIKMVNGSDLKPTVVGTFHVYIKRELQTMRGSNADATSTRPPTCPGSRTSTTASPCTAPRGARRSATPARAAPTAASTCPSRSPSGSSTSRPSAPRSPPTRRAGAGAACRWRGIP